MDNIIPNLDPDFEPQSRPRSGTWPLRRPNIENKLSNGNQGTVLGTTIEESSSQEMLASLDVDSNDFNMFTGFENNIFPSTLDGVLVGSQNTNIVAQMSTLQEGQSSNENNTNNIGSNNNLSQTHTTVTELHSQKQNLENNFNVDPQNSLMPPSNQVGSYTSSNDNLSQSQMSMQVTKSETSTPTANATTPKAKSSRKNAWGNMSYADLITQAVEASPEQRLTLAQIYEWMVKNIPYFKDKGDSNSSAGWKNSIRHNLSLHSKFKRIQNEGTGKSSWWVINHEAKPGKSPRRRATSMDTSSAKFKASRTKAAKQKSDLLKKAQKAKVSSAGEASWGRVNLETPISKALSSEFRNRTSSNASSLGGRLSPTGRMFLHDLEDDGAPPLSPHPGSNGNISTLSTSLPSAFSDLFSPDKSQSDKIKRGAEGVQEQLLESFAKTSIVPYGRNDMPENDNNDPLAYIVNQPNKTQEQLIQNTPNLTSLLQSSTSPQNQRNIKNESQVNQGFPASYAASTFSPSMSQDLQQGMNYQNENQMGKLSHSYGGNFQQNFGNMQQGQNENMFNSCSIPNSAQQNYNMSQQQDMNQYPIQMQQQQQQQNLSFPQDIDVVPFDSSDIDLNQYFEDFSSLSDTGFRSINNNYEMGMDLGNKPVINRVGAGGNMAGVGNQSINTIQNQMQDRRMCYPQQQQHIQQPPSQYTMQ